LPLYKTAELLHQLNKKYSFLHKKNQLLIKFLGRGEPKERGEKIPKIFEGD